MGQVFLSYSSKDKNVAKDVSMALVGRGFSVFFDEDSLPPSGDYHQRIEDAVARSDVFVFLITPDAVSAGSYALTELKYAKKKWRHPKGRVLPVLLRSTDWDSIPAYLKAVTVLEPVGNIAAEVASAVEEILQSVNRIPSGQTQIGVHAIEPVDVPYPSDGWEVVFSPMGKVLVDYSLWKSKYDIHPLRLKPRPSGVDGAASTTPIFSSDESAIYETAEGGRVLRWETSHGECAIVWEPEDVDFWAGEVLAISPDGEKLVSGGEKIMILDTRKWISEKVLWLDEVFAESSGWVRALNFSPDGSLLAVTLDDMIAFLGYPNWRILQTWDGPTGKMLTNTHFSPSGDLVVVSSQQMHEIEVRSIPDWNLVQRIPAHVGGVINAEFFLGNTVIISGGINDGYIKVWRIEDGATLAEKKVSSDGLLGFSRSPDGSLLFTLCHERDHSKDTDWGFRGYKDTLRFWKIV